MDRHTHGQVVTCTRRRSQIKYPKVAVGTHAAQYTGAVRTETSRIGARVRGQRCDTGVGIGIPDLDCAVPGRREERIFCNQVPVHGEDFARVFLP